MIYGFDTPSSAWRDLTMISMCSADQGYLLVLRKAMILMTRVIIYGNPYHKGYYLANDIYPFWSTFVKTVCNSEDEKCKRCREEQEAARKEVQHVFGVLQSRRAIVRHPART
jgi:hypothetical protein